MVLLRSTKYLIRCPWWRTQKHRICRMRFTAPALGLDPDPSSLHVSLENEYRLSWHTEPHCLETSNFGRYVLGNILGLFHSWLASLATLHMWWGWGVGGRGGTTIPCRIWLLVLHMCATVEIFASLIGGWRVR